MRKCKKWISFLLIISVLLAAVFGNLFLGQVSASVKASIRNICEGAEVKQGLAITGTMAQNNQESARATVTEWLRALGM